MHRGKNPREKFSKQGLKALLSYCKNYKIYIISAGIFAGISAIFTVIGPNLISKITETIEKGISQFGININIARVTKIGLLLVGMYLVGMILGYLQSYLMNNVSCKLGKSMRTEITQKINKIPLKYFDSHNFGDTLSRVTNDVDTISQSLNMSIGTLVSATITLLGCVVMMFITEWRMAFTAIISSMLGMVIMAVIIKKSQKHFVLRQESLAKVNAHIEEYFAGQNIVRAYNSEDKALEKFNYNNDILKQHTFKAEFLSGLMMPIMSFIGNLGYVCVCIVGAVLAFNGTINFSVVIAFMIYVRLFTSPLGQLGQGMANIQSAVAASERVSQFLQEEELSDESNKTKILTEINGDVEFKNIVFGYSKDKQIIHDFSTSIKAGQKVAIVGPTGAGKTTIVNLLMRFYELDGGSITIDGVNTADITRENVHKAFGMVLQDTWLFDGTIRENLTYGKKTSDEDLLRICEDCGLKHFIETLPNGLDTVLDDSLVVSAGQKQLLTIARAMVENAPMLILDEATSSVDTRTEIKIQNAMDKLTKGRTSFVIAHRLSTIKNADKIIYMKDGDIKETGTHDELIKQNGLYAELYNSQFANM